MLPLDKRTKFITGLIFIILSGITVEYERLLYLLQWRTRSQAMSQLGAGPFEFDPIFKTVGGVSYAPNIMDYKIAIIFLIIGLICIISAYINKVVKK